MFRKPRLKVAIAVQGLGGGAITFLSLTLTADLVPFNERGLYQGMLSLAWAFASAIGPPIVSFGMQMLLLTLITIVKGWCLRRKSVVALAVL